MKLEIRLAMVGRWFIGADQRDGDHRAGARVARRRLARDPVRPDRRNHRRLRRLARPALYGPASALVGVQVQIVSAFAVFERIFDYLDMPFEGGEARRCRSSCRNCAATIAFRGRDLRLRPDRPALQDVNFRSQPGKWRRSSARPAPARPPSASWCRASTIRQSGAVLIDGIDVRDLTVTSLRRTSAS